MRCIIVAGLLVVLVCGGCHRNVATGRTQLLLLSTSDTIALGEESKPALLEQYGGQVESRAVASYVELVGHSMAERTEADYPALPWEFTVLDSDVINAFALPGGKVFASRGLLVKLDNEAELAGVLGHEIGHVTAKHVNERISQQLLISGIVVGSSAAAGSSDSDWAVAVPILVGAAGSGYMLSFSRQQESEADEQGLKYMTAAGYDPRAMIDVLEVLKSAATGARPPEFLSTHPYPETRIETVSALLADTYAYTQNNPDFGTYPDRYRDDALRYLPEPEETPGEATAALPAATWCGVCRVRPDPPSGPSESAVTARQPRS